MKISKRAIGPRKYWSEVKWCGYTEEVPCIFNAGVAQLVERDLAKVEVVGSRPISRSSSRYGCVAQLAEHLTLNQGVVDSTSTTFTILKYRVSTKRLRRGLACQSAWCAETATGSKGKSRSGSNPDNPTSSEDGLHRAPVKSSYRRLASALGEGLNDRRAAKLGGLQNGNNRLAPLRPNQQIGEA
jgi:hypothetical protein